MKHKNLIVPKLLFLVGIFFLISKVSYSQAPPPTDNCLTLFHKDYCKSGFRKTTNFSSKITYSLLSIQLGKVNFSNNGSG
jgi:hypothetical protein